MTQELAIARNYTEARREYLRQRSAILNSSSGSMMDTGHCSRWAGGRATEQKAARLEDLERLQWVKEMHALERARDRIGAGLPVEMREALKKAILLNVSSGKLYPFERLYVIGISRRTFYRYRQRFLDDIASELSRTQPK